MSALHVLRAATFLVALSVIALDAQATERPLWEAGLGVGILAFSDYRGADTADAYVLPVPYLVYRGRFLRADREGLRGMFIERPGLKLNLSLNATTPVRRRSVGARAGMPALATTVEIGPSLELPLWRSMDERLRLELRVPTRASVAVGSSTRFVGWFIAPNVNLDIAGHGALERWNLGVMSGPLFADRRYHEYFYGVDPRFASAVRPAYAARGGYSGSQLLVSLTRRFPGYWVGGYARHDWLSHAAFIDSPLVRQNSSWSAGVAIAWIIGRSSRLVETDERE
jgi:outer membrane scaffolding protein for murein synthesis (MipA/OmpV family)